MTEIVKRFFSTSEISTLIEVCHRTARNKGWWPLAGSSVNFEPGDVEEKIVLIVSELSEAFEEYRKPNVDIHTIYAVGSAGELPWDDKHSKMEPMPKPEGFPVEMADAFIRLCDLAGALGVTEVDEVMVHTDGRKQKIGQHIYRLMKTALDDEDGVDAAYFGSLFAAIEGTCRELDINLDRAIALKMRYNETRPQRHGGKRA